MQPCPCPQCAFNGLTFTGAFWSCGRCSYAITSAALAAEKQEAHSAPIAVS